MPYQSRYMQEKFENANQEGEDRPYQSRFMKERFSNGAGVDTTDAHSEKQYQSNYMRERFKNGVDTYAKQEQEKQDQKTQQTPDNTPPENKSAAPEQPSSAERNQKRIEDELQAQRRESGLEAPVDTEDPGYFFKAANPDAEYSVAEPTQGGLAKYLGAKAVNGVKSGLEGLWNAGVGTLRIGQQNAIRDYYNEASPEEREKVFGSKTEDEAGQEYGGLYSDKYISGAKEKSAEIDKAYSDVSSTGAGKAMGEISSMIGNMAPNIALNLIAPGTGRLFAGVSAGGNTEKEARDNNASESSAYGYGILSAAANITFDSLFGGIPGIGKGVVDDAVQRIAKSETGKRLIRSVVDTLGEGAEDYLTQVTDAYLRKMWNGDNKNAVETLIAAQPDAIYAGLMGSLMSAVMSAPSNISAIANAPKFDKTAKAAHAGESLTPEQIGHANAAAMPLDLVGSEDWYDINMAKYKGNSDVPSAVKPQTDAPNLPVDPSTNPQSANIPIVPAENNAIPAKLDNVASTSPAKNNFGPNTVGAAEANPNSFYHMQNEYGTIEPGENPARVVDVPKSTDGKDKVSLYARTLMEAKATPESLIPEYEQYVADGLFSHNVKTDKAAMDSAVRTIKDKGYSGALAQWSDVVEGRRSATKEDTTLAQLLYTEAAKAGDTKGAMRLAAEIAVEGTRAGQVEQSMRLLKKMTPEGNLYYVQKSVDRLQHDLATGASIGIGVDAKTLKAFKAGDKKLTIPEDLAANLLNAKNEKEITAASEAIWQSVGQQLPANWVEKWNAWRYFAMLGNARTHIKNIEGNAVFWPARQLKNMTGSVLETVFVHDTSQRTKAVLNPLAAADKERLSFAKSDFDNNMRSVMMGSGKLNPANVIRESRDTFRTKPLNALVKGNGKALDLEDAIFSGNAYADSMAGYMKARKLTAADMTGHTLEQARSYALDQAKKATYRDDSAIASAINSLSKKNAATQIIVGGAAPFTKTPINIVKRGIEYSPVGISKALTYDARKVMKNEMTASELIEDLSAGLTGTGIMALGTYFASKGILTGGNKENKKEEQFDELQGGQNYALKLGDKSYTIDWMAPVALPLFVGTELWNAYNKDGTASLTRVLDALTSISEPMVNLTMLQGINNAIKTAGYSKSPLTDIISSTAAGYFGQAVPTLGGQIARSIDNTRRTTFTQAGGPLAVESKTLQKLGNKIPGVSQKNAPFVDQWGRTQQNAEGNLAQRLAYNMLSPGFYSTNKSTQVDNVLSELYQKTGDQRALPKFANKTQTVGDEKNRYEKKLTKDEYTEFAQDSGKKAYDLLDVLVPGYKKLTDEQSVSATEKAYEVATDLAKNTALGSPLTQTTKNILDAADKYSKDENKNVGIAEIIKANVIIRDIRSDEYPNGKPISGSAKRKKMQALVDSGYSRADAIKLYDLLNN